MSAYHVNIKLIWQPSTELWHILSHLGVRSVSVANDYSLYNRVDTRSCATQFRAYTSV